MNPTGMSSQSSTGCGPRNSGLTAEVQRQTHIGQDYARVASEQRVRVEELERENAIAHSSSQMLDRRLALAEERADELEELVQALRAQRDRLQTYYDSRMTGPTAPSRASAAMRDAASALLSRQATNRPMPLWGRGASRARRSSSPTGSRA